MSGSSPHTRGAPSAPASSRHRAGIIPAYAGSTEGETMSIDMTPDHPRIRGEHGSKRNWPHDTPGSSPHTRGARIVGGDRGRLPRIIPAYAGSTPSTEDSTRAWTDHPRIRGEHWSTTIVRVTAAGSSPHTRGALPCRTGRTGVWRIIPAYAGSTRGPADGPPQGRDHPRIRGEHASQ